MIRLDEIVPGAVAYLEPALLHPDSKRFRPASDQPFIKPHVCIEVDAETDGKGGSVWLSISSSPGIGGRIEILREWRLAGSPRWRKGDCYITHVGKGIWAPNERIIEASRSETDLTKCGRPHITYAATKIIHNAFIKAYYLDKLINS
ncbi:hypothetical protein [Xanthomonas phage XPV1]|uniref:Uncharacterized protein n=1 Tax=Xanthomonas phage XPV1 TaxID=2099860 RepID=A0A3S7I6F7_9CAUD|nr:hypothetical protein KEM12_gp49 [Xanthomonas phage XPV1]AVO24213.1 hypothetical protein [Xanthomonas phage XPV1]